MGALVYFGLVFGAGFVLGVIRTLLVVPQVGMRTAELLEMPLMVLATIVAARWVVLRFRVKDTRVARLSMGILALSMLVATEIVLGVLLRGMPVVEYFTARDPISGTAYFIALGLFAAMPSFVGRAVTS